MLKLCEKPSGENSTPMTETWLDEFLELIEPDGYFGLVLRDRSEHGSIYVWLHYPPQSANTLPRPTQYTFRISDHPPRPDKVPQLLGSIHPGQENVLREWKKAKAKIREDAEIKRRQIAGVADAIRRRKKK